MQTVKLTIDGRFYDSQIYAGRLYLWHEDSSIVTINWDELVEAIIEKLPDRLQFAAHCAFRKGSYLYGNEWKFFAKDSKMMELLSKRLNELAELAEFELQFSETELKPYIATIQDNPFPFPHADSLFFHGKLYVGNREGVAVSSRSQGRTTSIAAHANKIWDGPALSMAGRNYVIALAAGSEGIWEYEIKATGRDRDTEGTIRHRIERRAESVRWVYDNLFGSSYQGGYLADFASEDVNIQSQLSERPAIYRVSIPRTKSQKVRVLREVIPVENLFETAFPNGKEKYSWGSHDKICLAGENRIDVVQYHPRKNGTHFEALGSVSIDGSFRGDIVSADSAHFGYVLERDDGLFVMNSKMESQWIEGEPVNWRVFPDSQDYLNQLHIVHENQIYIHSYLQDYFVNQDEKRVGIKKGA